MSLSCLVCCEWAVVLLTLWALCFEGTVLADPDYTGCNQVLQLAAYDTYGVSNSAGAQSSFQQALVNLTRKSSSTRAASGSVNLL